jgi:membrane-associated phospholipid phosphatase
MPLFRERGKFVHKDISFIILLAIISLGSSVLASDLSRNDSTQTRIYQGKTTYSLLQEGDLAALEPSPAVQASAVKDQQKERGTTEPLFSIEFPKLLLRDTWYVLTSPVHWDARDWVIFSAATLGVAAVAFLDNPIQTQVQRNYNNSTNNIAEDIRCFGGACSFGVLGLFYAGGAYFHDDVAKAVAIDGAAASLVASGIITPILKWGVGRARPDAGLGNHYFTPFSGSNESFPSGETTQAFAVASVIAAHYDELWIKVSSYGVASLVGMARIYEDAHWTSDALAGALIGTAAGMAIVHYNEKRRKEKKEEQTFFITPLLASHTAGIGITLVR